VYLVLLELNGRPAGEYGDLERSIKALGNWSNRMRGMWMVETRFTAAQVRDLLKPHIVAGRDRLFVQRMTTNWAGTNMGDGFSDWMARRKFV
jgi:hypothetical protein